MPWNLTSLAAGCGRMWSWRRGSGGVARGEAARVPTERGAAVRGVAVRAARRVRAGLSKAERARLTAAATRMGADCAVLDRALASGVPLPAVHELAAQWESFTPAERAFIRDPLGGATPGPLSILGVPARQVDQTTCGAASLAMLLMVNNPGVAAWVATGRGTPVHPDAPAHSGTPSHPDAVLHRWEALQHAVHRRVRRRGLVFFPWPKALGTPPWRVPHVARYAGVRYAGRLVDDRSPAAVERLLAHAAAAVTDGIPVPLFVGADSRIGVQGLVPRHVVLLVARHGEDAFAVYEPGAGRIDVVADAAWTDGAVTGTKQAAWGFWWRPAWVFLPRRRTLRA